MGDGMNRNRKEIFAAALLVTAMLSALGNAQDTRYRPTNEQIPPQTAWRLATRIRPRSMVDIIRAPQARMKPG
jgi:hypothetical protein